MRKHWTGLATVTDSTLVTQLRSPAFVPPGVKSVLITRAVLCLSTLGVQRLKSSLSSCFRGQLLQNERQVKMLLTGTAIVFSTTS